MSHRFELPEIGAPASIAFPRPTVTSLPNGLTVQAIAWPAVPVSVTSSPLKPFTCSEKTAVKWIGWALVGSACRAAWSIVTSGLVAS